eukprot:TRINITY_DN1208_c0_g1_i20.p1 TRINITY_DN1208_c0_g1~~TRINITY_DN1208_c0_g1_i20.p1  ORF type:complete len:119 (-),score=24.47 TRINITY_DN1208_c0_g1_i20:40-396(-)
MLLGGFSESGGSVINLPTVPSDVFSQVILYLYGENPEFSPQNCIDMLRLADEYGLEELKLLCELYIHNGVEKDNVDIIEQVSIMYNSKRLLKYCQEFKLALQRKSIIPTEKQSLPTLD